MIRSAQFGVYDNALRWLKNNCGEYRIGGRLDYRVSDCVVVVVVVVVVVEGGCV